VGRTTAAYFCQVRLRRSRVQIEDGSDAWLPISLVLASTRCGDVGKGRAENVRPRARRQHAVTVGHTVTPRSAGLNGNRELKGMLPNPKWMRRHINEVWKPRGATYALQLARRGKAATPWAKRQSVTVPGKPA
jgi:hypothetical protein